MDKYLVYVKTPTGDEAVRQSTHVVNRNLRMVLVQVDGKLSVAELSTKIGNRQLVETALRDLESGGFIAPTLEGVSVWKEERRKGQVNPVSTFSDFSSFEPAPNRLADVGYSRAMASSFSRFDESAKGKPHERVFHQKAATPAAEESKKPAQKTENPFAWLRVLPILVAGVFFVALLTLIFYPYDNLRPRIEAAASQYLQTPVLVSSVQLQLFPKPALILSNIKIGEKGDSSLDRVTIPPLSLLGSGQREIERVDVSGASFAVDRLLKFPGFGSVPQNTDSPLTVKRLVIDRLSVSAGTLVLDGLQGEYSRLAKYQYRLRQKLVPYLRLTRRWIA